jgi:hypothetical protein
MPKKAIWRGRLIRHGDLGRWLAIGALWAFVLLALLPGQPSNSKGAALLFGFVFTAVLGACPEHLLNFAPLFLRASAREKGYQTLTLGALGDLLQIFSPEQLLRLPAWEDLKALPGANPDSEFHSIKRVLANALHDIQTLREVLRDKGYVKLRQEEVWTLASLYGNLALLELPTWDELLMLPGINRREQAEAMKSVLARSQPIARDAVYDLEGFRVRPRRLEDFADGQPWPKPKGGAPLA